MLIPYGNFADVAKCSLSLYTRYARLFFYLNAFQTILALSLTALTTVLHAIPGYDEFGYLAGFAATFVIAINSLIPFRDASKQSSEASLVLARHINLQESMSGKLLYKLTNTPTLWLSHPTSYCVNKNVPRTLGQSRTMESNRQTQNSLSQNTAQTRQSNGQTRTQFVGESGQRKNPFVGESGQTTTRDYARPSSGSNGVFRMQSVNQMAIIKCVIKKFDLIASRLFGLYYVIMIIQITFTILTSLFHAFNSMTLIEVPPDTARVFGLAFGGVSTLLGTVLATFPIEVAARQSREAYALTFEYYVSGSPVPDSVLDCLYEVNTLCFQNPMYESKCIQLGGGSQILPVTAPTRNIIPPRL